MAGIRVMRSGECVASAEKEREVSLLFTGEYREGDEIEFTSDSPAAIVSVDSAIAPARLWLPEKRFTYRLPLSDDNRAVYAPVAFTGNRHLLSIAPDESNERRNLAVNPLDQRERNLSNGAPMAYPHATANVETRNESVFCARNAIDGLTIAAGHGVWPYQSWGIGARTDAYLTLDFGREVELDEIALYLRADFPHDAYWTQATITFSDETREVLQLRGINGKQAFPIAPRRVRWLRLSELIKCDMPSAFPALRQIMTFGRDTAEPRHE